MDTSEIKLIIKAPNQKLEDQVITCNPDWSVERLKSHISTVYPSKPKIEEQRLIYSGHLLKNEQILRHILEPISEENETFTVHLVCSQKQNETNKKSSESGSNSETSVSYAATTETTATSQTLPATGGESQSLNQSAFLNAFGSFPMVVPPFGPQIATTPEQIMQQMALMQQMYAQYMQQFMNQPGINLSNAPLNPSDPLFMTVPTAVTSAVPPPPTQQTIPPQITQQAVPQPQVQQQPPVQRLNAGPAAGPAAPDDEDDPNNRDWLDWFYWMSRVTVLMSIVYFYSSFSRFLVLLLLAVLMYFYKIGLLTYNRGIRPQDQPRDQNVNNNGGDADARQIQDMMDGNIDNNHRQVNSTTPEETGAAAQPQTEDRFSGVRLVWMIISSLFSSLIPEQPAPVNLN